MNDRAVHQITLLLGAILFSLSGLALTTLGQVPVATLLLGIGAGHLLALATAGLTGPGARASVLAVLAITLLVSGTVVLVVGPFLSLTALTLIGTGAGSCSGLAIGALTVRATA